MIGPLGYARLRMTVRAQITRRIAGQAARFPQLDLRPLELVGLDARDESLGQALDQTVARHWLTLAAIAESQLSAPWERLEPGVQAALLVGVAQLLLFEKIPDHAAIHETVEWTKQRVRRKAGGLVNAVLRRVVDLRGDPFQPDTPRADSLDMFAIDELPLADGRIMPLRGNVFADEPMTRLAQQTSHPEKLLRDWQTELGDQATVNLALHDLTHPPTIVAGVEPECDDDRLSAHDDSGHFVFSHDGRAIAGWLAEHPTAWVQDPAAAAAVNATQSLMPELIVDVCAGRGTKTRQLLSVHPQASVIASDGNPSRLAILREQFTDLERVEIVEPRQLVRFSNLADLVLVDVPCSNTGVLARRVEAKYRYRSAALESLVSTQRQIVADALALIPPGGHLLYSTCSLQSQENEAQVAWIRQWHPLDIRHQQRLLPHGRPGDSPSGYRDGGFFSLLKRRIE